VDATPRQHKRGGQVDYEQRQQITARTLADTVLLGWEGLEGDDGQPLPYSPETAKDLLLDPQMLAFRDAVSWAATVAGEQALGNSEEAAGN
jgi:hypothetical protein